MASVAPIRVAAGPSADQPNAGAFQPELPRAATESAQDGVEDNTPRTDLKGPVTAPRSLDAPSSVAATQLRKAAHARILVGHNDPARDLATLQGAADRGGAFRLKGTFDLGDTGSVNITRDVSFRGAHTDDDSSRPTIRNGTWAFYSHLPAAPVTKAGPSIEIANLAFDGTAGAPLHAAYSRRIAFHNNSVSNVRPLPVGDYIRASAAVIGTRDAQNGNAVFLPGAVTGPISVTGNSIDLKVPAPTTVNGTAVQIQFADHVDAVFAHNTIKNYSRNCADALDNRGGSVVIANNYCESGKEGVPSPTPRAPNGVVVGWYFDQPAVNMAVPERNPSFHVLHNHIKVNGATSFGLYSSVPNAVIADNDVNVGGGATALGILTIGPGSIYRNNRITGSGQAAVFVANSLPGVSADGNTYDHIDSSGFTPSQAHYFFAPGTKDNVVIAPSGNVIDKGANKVEPAPTQRQAAE